MRLLCSKDLEWEGEPARLFSQGYCEDQKRKCVCKASDSRKTITGAGVCDAVSKADEKATGEKAASALDLLINCWHVRLPLG